jgi:uncharacterized protein HemX
MLLAVIYILLVIVVALAIYFGYQLAQDRLSAEHRDLDTQREVLRTEWHGLEQARKVNDVFFAARDALRQAERDAR